ncbi:TolB family protein [Zavarzinella formosa]|uniref:TolB family protein n=1 Tax=Zavarzinella formosa TaxID=360055 RepID=UPI0012F93B00|nr:hypothetical protein [Zavarzinella formosa]
MRSFVSKRPAVPIVFTSRTEPASFQTMAMNAEGFAYPGAISWTAREGRLRLLDTNGRLFELTWGRTLHDGGTLIDVMSPSVSIDGNRVLFAGRRAAPDAGHWRIYQVNVDGSNLIQLTGGPDDPGCIALPPLRYAADGSRLSDDERRRIDYDDVDPTDLGPNGFAFASSRIPDLGRDHSRRATQIWSWPPGASAPSAQTGNRNNDRWPILLTSDQIMFGMWSRNREAVTEDRSDVRPVSAGGVFATTPTDRWMGVRLMYGGADFSYAIKSIEPVWRPRPLFNGRVVFMTPVPGEEGRLRLAQADWGYIRSSPSSLQPGADLPDTGGAKLLFGPGQNEAGRELSASTPNPCPNGSILFSASEIGASVGGYGLYLVDENWTGPVIPQLVFDDPEFVDAEPVAIYKRGFPVEPTLRPVSASASYTPPSKLLLAGNREYFGPAGYLENLAVPDAIRNPIPWHAPSAEQIDPRKDPLVPPPPNLKAVAFYAAHRDRFDDPKLERVSGGWEKLMAVPLESERALQTWIPADPLMPTVIVGLDVEGKIAKWTGRANDSVGRPGVYYAYAGDHYSGTRVNGYHYCNGCHTGHTFTPADIRERVK